MWASESVDVAVPVSTAYREWARFESFPCLLHGVQQQIERVDETRAHWVAEVDGVRRRFDTVITERRPDRRICWVSVHGPEQVGVVTFDEGTRPGRSRVTLQLEYSPRAVPDRVVDKRSFLQETVSGCLRRFAEVVEGRKRSGAGPQDQARMEEERWH